MEDKNIEKELNNAMDTSEIEIRWNQDPKGYFTIKPFFEKEKVFVRYYDSDNKLLNTFSCVNTSQFIQKIVDLELVSRLEHAAYLGKEVEKALIALKNKLDYVQDNELEFK